MPKKLMDCVNSVMNSGKSESEAWAICQKSTGLKPHKKKSEGKKKKKKKQMTFNKNPANKGMDITGLDGKSDVIFNLLRLADRLDKAGLYVEANKLDAVIAQQRKRLTENVSWEDFIPGGIAEKFKDWRAQLGKDPATKDSMRALYSAHQTVVNEFQRAFQALTDAKGDLRGGNMQGYLDAVTGISTNLSNALQNVRTVYDKAIELQEAVQNMQTPPPQQPEQAVGQGIEEQQQPEQAVGQGIEEQQQPGEDTQVIEHEQVLRELGEQAEGDPEKYVKFYEALIDQGASRADALKQAREAYELENT